MNKYFKVHEQEWSHVTFPKTFEGQLGLCVQDSGVVYYTKNNIYNTHFRDYVVCIRTTDYYCTSRIYE